MNELPENAQLTADETGQRTDVFLSKALTRVSRRQARLMCEQGLVRVNGSRVPPGKILSAGDVIEIKQIIAQASARPELAKSLGGPQQHMTVLYEDEYFLAVAKPGSMSSVTLQQNDPLTLADCIAAYCPEAVSASADPREAGLVQRLDYYTSGVLLAAKKPEVWNSLHHQLLAGEMKKKYFALIEGKLSEEKQVNLPLVQSDDGKSMIALADENIPDVQNRIFPALTLITPKGSYYSPSLDCLLSLVKAEGFRVRRHQIRVHLAAQGHPLVGDKLYGSRFSGCGLAGRNSESLRPGFFLHAASIEFCHPMTFQQMTISAENKELEDIRALIKQ